MNIPNFKDLSLEELRANFLAGQYDNENEHYEALKELHNKLTSFEELIPLLTSNDRHCQYTASYIAGLEGGKVKGIFSYLYELIESPWEEVRYEICECFASCASTPKHFISLFNHLEDSAQSIRLSVLTVMCGLQNKEIKSIYDYLLSQNDKNELIKGVSLLVPQVSSELSFEHLKEQVTKGSKVVKSFAYIAAYKSFGNSDRLLKLAELSNDPDILRHHSIYFYNDLASLGCVITHHLDDQ